MKRIHYVEDHVVTGDDIAAAVVSYARSLAIAGRSDTVDLPGLDDAGEARRYQLLLGPASQMLVSDEPWAGVEVLDAELVADIEARSAGIAGPQPVATGEGEPPVATVSLETDEFLPVDMETPTS